MPVRVYVEEGVELGENAVALEEGGVGQVPPPQVQQPGQLVQGRHHHAVIAVLYNIQIAFSSIDSCTLGTLTVLTIFHGES